MYIIKWHLLKDTAFNKRVSDFGGHPLYIYKYIYFSE